MRSYDHKIVKNLKLATKIENKDLAKVLQSKKFDIVLFVIDTDYNDLSFNISKYILKVSERFKSLGIKSVLISYYDVNENGLYRHEGKSLKTGDVVMFPASSKNMIKFNNNLTVKK